MSFEEIIRMMENAEDYMDLYDAASYIVDDDLRVDVEQLIEQCEDDGEDVETTYSIVTSDLLDMKMYELNESVDIDGRKVCKPSIFLCFGVVCSEKAHCQHEIKDSPFH